MINGRERGDKEFSFLQIHEFCITKVHLRYCARNASRRLFIPHQEAVTLCSFAARDLLGRVCPFVRISICFYNVEHCV